MNTRTIVYQHEATRCVGYLAIPNNAAGKSPAVMVAHDWGGCNEFAKQKAEQLAELGYIGFAIDMFGESKTGNTNEEKASLMMPLKNDRALLKGRIVAALNHIKTLAEVDAQKIAAIGFCFGGLCVLDLARSGADVRGVVSFHGLLMAPEHTSMTPITAKVLALHGHDDPMAPHDQVVEFMAEMTARKADWQVYLYGGVMHAFMNPHANDPNFGTVYNSVTEKRAWQSMKDFLAEIF